MKELWVEKYRPKSINDYLFNSGEIEKSCRYFIENQEIPNLLLSGTQGVGKSTLYKVLLNEIGIDKSDIKRLNASTKTGIDQVREIEDFCQSGVPFNSPFKVIILEEANGLSRQAQEGLKDVTENYTKYCRFIFTTNHPQKIIPELHSRFQWFHFDVFGVDKILEFVLNILIKENIEIQDESVLYEHINKYKPDLRKIINSLQQSSPFGVLNGLSTRTIDDSLNTWKELWAKPDLELLQELVKQADITSNFDDYYEIMYMNVKNLQNDLHDNAYISIAEHLYRCSFVSNQEINLNACLIKIFRKL